MKQKYRLIQKIAFLVCTVSIVMLYQVNTSAQRLTLLQPALTVIMSGSVATPLGTTYSVSHRVGVDLDGPGGEPPTCFSIFIPSLPGAPDDIVTYDGLVETIRTDLRGTVPIVTETSTAGDGNFLLAITTTSFTGTDLFPGGITDAQKNPLTDACFTIGADDPLSWPSLDTVAAAIITLSKDGVVIRGPINITGLFSNPWDGTVNAVIPDVAGSGINQVKLELFVNKDSGSPANDDCVNAQSVLNGITDFSNVGANTDGLAEPEQCDFNGSTAIDSDVWFEYIASCTGDIIVDTCNSLFDTKIAIYNGCNVCPPGGQPLACNDDAKSCGPLDEQSRIKIPTSQNDCYTIRVGGFQGDQGPGSLRIDCVAGACCINDSCTDDGNEIDCLNQSGIWFPRQRCSGLACPNPPPVHDECGSCIFVDTDMPYPGSSESATGSDITLNNCGFNDVIDVWHCWEADCTGLVNFALCGSEFDTTLALYDQCGGNQLACNDDDCLIDFASSTIDYSVTQGTTYRIRVSGVGESQGNYTLNIASCVEETRACCFPNFPTCFPFTVDECLSNNGAPGEPGSTCLGDHNQNLIDDACEECPSDILVNSFPPQCSNDARIPHNPSDQNMAMGWDVIKMTFDCAIDLMFRSDFIVTIDPPGTPPMINQVTILGNTATIMLDTPIPADHITCFEHEAGATTCVGFLPGDVTQDGITSLADVNVLLENLNNTLAKPLEFWQCDIDRSGKCGPGDMLSIIDLFNGGGAFEPWLNETLPEEPLCP